MHASIASARSGSAFFTAAHATAALRRVRRAATNDRMASARAGGARAELSPDVAQNVVNSITGTIKFGAPMFNAGDAKGCAKLYRQTALGIIRDTAVTSDQIKTCLKDAVARADAIAEVEADSESKVAWALRRGLDTAVNLILNPPPDEPMVYAPDADAGGAIGDDAEEDAEKTTTATTTTTPTVDQAELFDFAASPEIAGRWRSLNDGIMGGVSDGAMAPLDGGGGARFTGVVRLENNGGFASVRASFGSGIDLSQFAGLYLDVKPGDAASAKKQYLIIVKDAECMSTQVNFKATFSCAGSADDEGGSAGWGRVRVPFGAFDRPERMVRRCAPPGQ